VWTKPGDILVVLKAVDLVTPGDVLLIDGGGREDAAVIGDIVGKALADLGCVPRERLAEVVALARAVDERETAWRAAIAGGESLPSATGIDALLAELRTREEPPTP
jgi:regulator of RNase E activity RraA